MVDLLEKEEDNASTAQYAFLHVGRHNSSPISR